LIEGGFGGGSNAEAGCNLAECWDDELGLRIPLVEMGGGGGGSLGRDAVVGSELEESSRTMRGFVDKCGARTGVEVVSSVEDEGDRRDLGLRVEVGG
jgi:hypothetical protein